jgi:NAD+ synthase (glutamine-hydrolysing)
MRIALAQLNYIIGNFEYNYKKIAESIDKAKAGKADIIIFSELAICGYPPHDLLEQKAFVENCQYWINQVALLCDTIAAVVGGPSINPHSKGKILYNTAFFLHNKTIQSIHHKALLPTYDIFDEYRYFEPGTEFNLISFKGKKIAITICEDLWDDPPVENPFGHNRLYKVSPMKEFSSQKPDFIINIAASPFAYNKIKIKQEIFTAHAAKYKVPLFYVNQVGAHTDLIFDGGSLAVDAKGNVTDALELFKEDFRVFELDNQVISKKISINNPEIEKIHDALVLGIKDYFIKTNLKNAIIGLSGGIDSAVTLVTAVNALGNENVRVLLMPSKYSSEHSVKDAIELANNLKVHYDITPIQPSVDSLLDSLKPIFAGLPEDIAEENIQARVRGLLLMALSNKFGNILLNTSNKSEIAVGYGTLYGDMNGGLSILGDMYKTDVYRLAEYINRNKEIIPLNIIKKPPSAELKPNQKDTDSLPEYGVLDAILFRYIEQQKNCDDIIKEGFDEVLVLKVLKMVNFNEYKRFQTPPILRISSKAFGAGRKMPIVARY